MDKPLKKRIGQKWLRSVACVALAAVLALSTAALNETASPGDTAQPPEDSAPISSTAFLPNQIKKETGGKTASRSLDQTDALVCESSRLALYVDEERAVIKIQDKENGYVWSSGLDEADVAELTATWQRFAQAPLVAEYVDRYAPTTPVREFPTVQKIVKKDDGLELHCQLQKLAIQLTMTIRLNEDSLTVSIPDSQMKVTNDTVQFRLARISVLPFLGAVESGEADGYLFIPDGSGALIRFGDTKKYSLSYTARIYGKDFGSGRISEIEADFPAFQDLTANLPVFGIAHGNDDNAFAAIITGGAEYTDINANPAGARIDYFWGCPVFNYLEAYYQPTGTGKGFTYLPDSPNTVNAEVTYTFLSGREASYVGMANRYKKMLVDSGALVKRTGEVSQIPLNLQAYMAEQEKGLIGTHTKALTSLKDVQEWAARLHDAGVANQVISLTGFNRKGLSGSAVGDFRVEGKIGGEAELRRLYEQLSGQGGRLLLNMNYGAVYEHQAKIADLAMNIDHSLAGVQDIGYLYDTMNFLSAQSLNKFMQKLPQLPDCKKSLLLQGIGSSLLSDYRKGKTLTRTQALEMTVDALQTARDSLDKVGLEAPNAYAFPFADYILNTPDTHSQYIYETDTVPFLQIVLSGYVECFSSPLNFGSLSQEDVLRLIDFNMYPAYLATDCLASDFSGTNVLDIYFSDYASVEPYILREYPLINEILLPVYGKAIVNRTVVENGVSVVEYEGGVEIVVNYNAASYQYGDVEVKGKTAALIGG